MKVINFENIQQLLSLEENLEALIKNQRQSFIDFSKGRIQCPFPLQMSFNHPPGDCHVKAGSHVDDDVFVVKVATGFYHNSLMNLPSGDGVILVFSRTTGLLKAILIAAPH